VKERIFLQKAREREGVCEKESARAIARARACKVVGMCSRDRDSQSTQKVFGLHLTLLDLVLMFVFVRLRVFWCVPVCMRLRL